jgi:2-methylisocitrate lyase-like PEP mutase family enzyme
LGVPDIGILTQTEMMAHVRAMVAATRVPLLVDIDTGYGGVHNVVRTIQEVEDAGASAVQIEDQGFPKRCGHFENKTIVPIQDMAAKILAAVEARRRGLLLIARTDAIAIEGFEAAIERARIYKDCGADIIFVEAPEDENQVRALPGLVDAPMLINLVEGGKTPFLPPSELEEAGYSMIAFANFGLRAVIKTLRERFRELNERQTTEGLFDHIVSWEERQETVDLDGYDQRESAWFESALAKRSGQPIRVPSGGRELD